MEIPPTATNNADSQLIDETSQWFTNRLNDLETLDRVLPENAPNRVAVTIAATIDCYAAAHRHFEHTTKQVALHAIQRHDITQRAVADILEVHPNTISRWITASEVQPPELD